MEISRNSEDSGSGKTLHTLRYFSNFETFPNFLQQFKPKLLNFRIFSPIKKLCSLKFKEDF